MALLCRRIPSWGVTLWGGECSMLHATPNTGLDHLAGRPIRPGSPSTPPKLVAVASISPHRRNDWSCPAVAKTPSIHEDRLVATGWAGRLRIPLVSQFHPRNTDPMLRLQSRTLSAPLPVPPGPFPPPFASHASISVLVGRLARVMLPISSSRGPHDADRHPDAQWKRFADLSYLHPSLIAIDCRGARGRGVGGRGRDRHPVNPARSPAGAMARDNCRARKTRRAVGSGELRHPELPFKWR
jgi:hypothetical protein